MDLPILKDKNVFPDNDVLKKILKENFKNIEMIGKLRPLQINVNKKDQILDILEIIEYKKKNIKN